jgi:tetratricopeptide (TPR) repeat protein
MSQAPCARTTLFARTCLVGALVGATICVTFPRPMSAEDVVLIESASDPTLRLKKAGQIVDYTGEELTLRSALGATERIPARRVLEIKTIWPAEYEAGQAARLKGDLDDAIAAFQQAKRAESRPWALRQIGADLAGAFLETGRIAAAVEEFLPIAAADPATPHWNVVPIASQPPPSDSVLESRAAQWLADERNEAARLLGASWLLAGGKRAAATRALEALASSSNSRIAALATIQIWRTKVVTATPADAARWQTHLASLPLETQATGWFVLGELLARQDQPEAAALAYLKAPLLFRERRGLAADALLAAGKQLEKMGQTSQAAGLYREVVRDFAHLPAAKEAESLLSRAGL